MIEAFLAVVPVAIVALLVRCGFSADGDFVIAIGHRCYAKKSGEWRCVNGAKEPDMKTALIILGVLVAVIAFGLWFCVHLLAKL